MKGSGGLRIPETRRDAKKIFRMVAKFREISGNFIVFPNIFFKTVGKRIPVLLSPRNPGPFLLLNWTKKYIESISLPSENPW